MTTDAQARANAQMVITGARNLANTRGEVAKEKQTQRRLDVAEKRAADQEQRAIASHELNMKIKKGEWAEEKNQKFMADAYGNFKKEHGELNTTNQEEWDTYLQKTYTDHPIKDPDLGYSPGKAVDFTAHALKVSTDFMNAQVANNEAYMNITKKKGSKLILAVQNGKAGTAEVDDYVNDINTALSKSGAKYQIGAIKYSSTKDATGKPYVIWEVIGADGAKQITEGTQADFYKAVADKVNDGGKFMHGLLAKQGEIMDANEDSKRNPEVYVVNGVPKELSVKQDIQNPGTETYYVTKNWNGRQYIDPMGDRNWFKEQNAFHLDLEKPKDKLAYDIYKTSLEEASRLKKDNQHLTNAAKTKLFQTAYYSAHGYENNVGTRAETLESVMKNIKALGAEDAAIGGTTRRVRDFMDNSPYVQLQLQAGKVTAADLSIDLMSAEQAALESIDDYMLLDETKAEKKFKKDSRSNGGTLTLKQYTDQFIQNRMKTDPKYAQPKNPNDILALKADAFVQASGKLLTPEEMTELRTKGTVKGKTFAETYANAPQLGLGEALELGAEAVAGKIGRVVSGEETIMGDKLREGTPGYTDNAAARRAKTTTGQRMKENATRGMGLQDIGRAIGNNLAGKKKVRD